MSSRARKSPEPGIVLPRRAPRIELKAAQDAAWSTATQGRIVLPPKIFIHPGIKSVTTLQVFGMIAMHAKPDGFVRVGQARLAALIGCSQQLVSRHVKLLLATGFLEIPHKVPANNGHSMNTYRVVFDPEISLPDARSIASHNTRANTATQHNHNTQGVVISDGESHNTQAVVNTSPTTPQSNTITTRVNGSQSLHPDCSRNCELIKPLHNKLETAEAVISCWLMCAWKHGREEHTANEDDLATAHALVAQGITADQLEHAILPMTESPRLAPVVRDLLA